MTIVGTWPLASSLGEEWLISYVVNHAVTVAVVLTGTTAILSFASLHDLAFRTVPNWVSVTLLLAAIWLRIADGSLIFGLLAGLIVLMVGAFCWQRGWLGGGDVKLLGACTMLVPPPLAVTLLLNVALVGGILALLYLTLGRFLTRPVSTRPLGRLRRICRVERYRIQRRASLPFASAIAAGVFVTLLKG